MMCRESDDSPSRYEPRYKLVTLTCVRSTRTAAYLVKLLATPHVIDFLASKCVQGGKGTQTARESVFD
jgi:hypothetical protein